jgi:hypothetical protein
VADPVRQVAQAVLYEGYLLWPYRRSALKNQHRWTIGGVYPASYGTDLMQTQCLVVADPDATVDVEVRFLHVVTRDVARCHGGQLENVAELTVGTQRYLAWEEATEREVVAGGLPVAELPGQPCQVPVQVDAGTDTEWLTDAHGQRAGAVVRGWRELSGRVDIGAEPVAPGIHRLTVRVANTIPWRGQDRTQALHRTFVSAHTVIHAERAQLVSLTDPPRGLAALAEGCRNIGAWPVLIGAEGECHTMLSAPIILPDYPQVAPESPGDLFDATEIDQLLTLNILTLGDDERQEMRDSDPRARAILDRCATLTQDQLMLLHGRLREVGLGAEQDQLMPFEGGRHGRSREGAPPAGSGVSSR